MLLRRAPRRRAASLVEFAVVGPITLLLMIALIVGGLGVYRYQQVATLAREGSRYASVHGDQYAKETGNPAATADDVYQKAIVPKAAGLDTSQLSSTVTWNTDNKQYHTIASNGQVVPVYNTVTVTVTYQWIPEAVFGGLTLRSTSTATMAY
jgi:Flp pilus assembly protein TadG